MTSIFNFFGNIFGYVLWAAFLLFKNYGIAIFIFTLVCKIVMFPFSIKQQKSMAANARIQAKMAEIRKKYGNDKQKFNEETAKLYDKEGVSPTGGCFTSLAPMMIMLGVYYSVINPLTNSLHIASESVTKIVDYVSKLPGVGSNMGTYYDQIVAVKLFPSIRQFVVNDISAADVSKLDKFSSGFNFLGLDLLSTPSDSGFASMLWLIPVLCFVTSVLSSWFSMKLTGNGNAQQGCIKWMMLLLPLFTAYIAYSCPAAVGFYWIMSTVLGFATTVILQHWYSPAIMEAKAEASRVLMLEQEEKKLKFNYVPRMSINTENQGIKANQSKNNANNKKNNKNNKNNKKR